VTQFGMSERLGPRTFGRKEELVFLGREISETRNYSEKVAEEIDEEVRQIIDKSYHTAKRLLGESRSKLEQIVATLLEEQRRAAEEQFARMVEKQASGGPRLRPMIKTGTASEVIAECARAERADLIILATHGRTGLAHMLMGSVAEKVVRTAPCPVLTVRGKKKPARKR